MSVDGSELYKVALRRFTDSANNERGCLDEMVTSKIASVSAKGHLTTDPQLTLARVHKIRQDAIW